MNPILEESALPTTTSNPDVEPTYVLGTPLSKRLDRMEYEYDDEQSVDGVWEDGRSLRSQPSRDDDAMSTARTFGVRSRAGTSLRQYASFDSSLRQNVPTPSSPTLDRQGVSPVPPIPPKSPARTRGDSVSLDDQNGDPSPTAGPSRLRERHYAPSLGTLGARTQSELGGESSWEAGASGSETTRSTTPSSSFYASPRRRQPGHITPRESSLPGDDAEDRSATPRAEPHRSPPGSLRTSDEGFDSRSNSTGSHSLRSHPPVPVDANLRSMPGVVGLGDGWAGGPQGTNKKRKLWFMKKPKVKEEDDPLKLWDIQENGATDGQQGTKTGPRMGVLKEAWNRSISKFGSMPALVSGDQVNGQSSGGGPMSSVKAFLSRSRVDLTTTEPKAEHPEQPEKVDPDERKAKRRTVAFFGLSKSQLDVSTRKSDATTTFSSRDTDALQEAPPSPSPAPRSLPQSTAGIAHKRDLSNVAPITVPPRDARRLSLPISAPAGPGGLPPPWRPQAFSIPRPEPDTPAPRPFSRHGDHDGLEQIDENPADAADQAAPSMIPGGSEGPQTSVSSGSVETPKTGSMDSKSLKHKHSSLLASEEGDHSGVAVIHDSPPSTPTPLCRPISVVGQFANPTTPVYSLPRNTSTPGLDTLEDWAAEGKRPTSRILRPVRAPTPRSREPSQQSTSSRSTQLSFFGRLKQALAVPETPPPSRAFAPPPTLQPSADPSSELETDKELPDLPSRTSTPLKMPGAFPMDSPEPVRNSPLPPSPYDITQAVAQEMLATPPSSRPTSRMTARPPRSRAISGDMWIRRLSKINESNGSDVDSRPTSRQDKRRSYSALAGRFGFSTVRRNSARSDNQDGRSVTSENDFAPASLSLPALDALEFGEDDLGLDDILDATRRMSLVRDLEAALPLPPHRENPSDTSSPPRAASLAMTASSSEATVLAAPITLDSSSGHRSHPSTSTAASSSFDRDENIWTPLQNRRSLDKAIEERRGSQQSDDSDRRMPGHRRGHRRGASMGSIGELAHDLLYSSNGTNGVVKSSASKRGSVILDEEDEVRLHQREREERTMSFASGVSSLSSAMSLDEEEAVPMSAVRVASPQQVKPRHIELGSPSQGIRASCDNTCP